MPTAGVLAQALKKEISLESNGATRGIRGAISVSSNTKEDIKSATVELLEAILSANDIKKEDIAFTIFTVTKDLNAAFPAAYARTECGFEYVPMMCYEEMGVVGSIQMCLRVLLVINTHKNQKGILHQYLGEAKKLRPDL